MKIAYIVLKSPQDQSPSHSIKRFSNKDEATVILFEDGVYQALISDASSHLKKAASNVLVAKDDLIARGFEEDDLIIGNAVEYDEIVDAIMEKTERTITL